MGKCFVAGCHSGYDEKRRKNNANGIRNPSIFQAPKDSETFLKWRNRIPRADRKLTASDGVCDLHFTEDCIERYYITRELPDGSTFMLKRGIPLLKKGSVPSIFPTLAKEGNSFTNCEIKQGKKLKLTTKKKKIKKINKKNTKIHSEYIDKEPEKHIDEELDHVDESPAEYIEPASNVKFNFQYLIASLNNLKMPSKWWCFNVLEDYIALICWDTNYTISKKIIIDSNLNIKIFFREQEFTTEISRNTISTTICSTADVTCWLKAVDELIICPSLQSRNNVIPYCCGYTENAGLCKLCSVVKSL